MRWLLTPVFAGFFIMCALDACAAESGFPRHLYQPLSLDVPVTGLEIAGRSVRIISGVRKTEGASGGPVSAVLALDAEGEWQWVETEESDRRVLSNNVSSRPSILAFDRPHTGEDSVIAFRYYMRDDAAELLRIRAERLIHDVYLKPAPVIARIDHLVWDESFGLFRFRQLSQIKSKHVYHAVELFFEQEFNVNRLP